MAHDSQDTFLSFLQGFVLGGVIGAGIALLYAPKPGTETRQEIASRSRDFKADAEKQYDQALERAVELKERAEKQIDTLLKQSRAHTNEWRDKAGEKISDVKEAAKKIPNPMGD